MPQPRSLTESEALAAAIAGDGPITLEPVGPDGPKLEVWFRDVLGASCWCKRHATEFAARTMYDRMRAAVEVGRAEGREAA